MTFPLLLTPLTLALVALALLNAVCLGRESAPLSRVVGSVLLLGLLPVFLLPFPAAALPVVLALVIVALTGYLLRTLLRSPRRPGSGAYVATAVAASLAMGLLFGLRPHPFEYPGDSVEYLQNFVQSSLQPPTQPSCLAQSWRQFTYLRTCTIWGELVQAGRLQLGDLLGEVPQRLTITLEIAVLGLSYFRLLQVARVGAAAAALGWILVAFGLGNQSISFLVNNTLQGSILAAAVFLEASMFALWALGWRTGSRRQVATYGGGILLLTYLELKLHGAFALSTLILLVPLAGLLGAARLWGHGRQPHPIDALPRDTARLLLLGSLGLLALVLTVKTGWLVEKQNRFIVRWSFLALPGLPSWALPASFFMRSPGSRPESLAVAALAVGFVHLGRTWRPGAAAASARAAEQPRAAEAPAAAAASPTDEARLYDFLASLYGLSVVVAYLLPPVSHLYINLPYEVISNYRLMWGAILFSPLPRLLQSATEHTTQHTTEHGGVGRATRWAARAAVGVIAAVVLIPVPGRSAGDPQRFWSKSRHILFGSSARADMGHLATILIPVIEAARPPGSTGPIPVLADEMIGTALAPYVSVVRPIHPTRVTDGTAFVSFETHSLLHYAASDRERLAVLRRLKVPPLLVIQEIAVRGYYSPYAEIKVYEKGIVTRISSAGVNALPPAVLRAAGFAPWRSLDSSGRTIGDPAAGRVVYRIWKRTDAPQPPLPAQSPALGPS